MTKTTAADLVVLSHLRWVWVWQRPQHLISRMARQRAAQGGRTWFVEEPEVLPGVEPGLRVEEHGDVTRVWLVLPAGPTPAGTHVGYQSPQAAGYADLLADLLVTEGRPPKPDVWVYTPMALDLVQTLGAGRVVYDVMDDLASFRDAPVGLVLRQRRLLDEADLVFTGGRSLHRSAVAQRQADVHLFPSGVDTAHYAAARPARARLLPRERPVAGYVGVLDERLDLELLAGLADEIPDWTIQMVGPVAKIDPASLPQRDNLVYPGMRSYAELPEIMAGFDVAVMPFALNDATRCISPTKTLEYLAAGLPVVSTRVADVVADYGRIVLLADDADGFAAACRAALRQDRTELERSSRLVLARQEWDTIAMRMGQLLDEVGEVVPAGPAHRPRTGTLLRHQGQPARRTAHAGAAAPEEASA